MIQCTRFFRLRVVEKVSGSSSGLLSILSSRSAISAPFFDYFLIIPLVKDYEDHSDLSNSCIIRSGLS